MFFRIFRGFVGESSPEHKLLSAVTVAVFAVSGCSNAPVQSRLAQGLGVDTLAAQQLGLLIGDYANNFAETVRRSAIKIERAEPTLEVRKAVLHWQIRAVPSVYTAASRSSPLFALTDLWVLALQQRDLFDREEAQVLGQGLPIAQEASQELLDRIELVAKGIVTSPDGLESLRTFTYEFADKHPIDDLFFLRASLAPLYVQFMQGQRSLQQSVSDVAGYAETALGLALAALNHAPDIARWQAELTLLDAESFPIVGRTVQTMDVLENAVIDLKAVADGMPDLVDKQRVAILQDIERQRLDTLRDIEIMRQAVFVDIGLEREAVLVGLDQQVQIVLDGLRAERETITGEIPNIAERAGQSMVPITHEAIDYAFYRAIQLCVLIAILFVAAVIVLRITHKRLPQ